MICSSVRIVRFIVRPFLKADSSRCWRKNPVAGQIQQLQRRWLPLAGFREGGFRKLDSTDSAKNPARQDRDSASL